MFSRIFRKMYSLDPRALHLFRLVFGLVSFVDLCERAGILTWARATNLMKYHWLGHVPPGGFLSYINTPLIGGYMPSDLSAFFADYGVASTRTEIGVIRTE